ncbi:interleukin-1 beta-like [Cyclopterus lumpus]|uniref:Interleukin-1 n=1 Tax=Cyclopterus lumpus TaxID=8103 RepID=A0A6M3RE35_CYCLU|nr:interleukin-1 beta-like [Cyclopterus lumpus]QJD08998.1 interleukin 1 beta [Cyclopterus lumpus]
MESEMKCNVSDTWSPKMPEGLDFEVSHHPLTMKQVVNLIVAMERFKGSESLTSTEFRDEDLLSMMLDSFMEEEIVFELGSAPQPQIRWTGEEQCSLNDGEKRTIVRVQNSMELHAVMLQGGSDLKKVVLNMSTYLNPAPGVEGRTVALGIKDTNLYLSCRKDGDTPTLHLEAVEDRTMLSGSDTSISLDSDMVRFLFYRQDTGVNISTLMSVAYQNWYVSTAQRNNLPLAMRLKSSNHSQIFSIREEVEHQS